MENTKKTDEETNSSIIELTAIMNELIENSVELSQDILSGIKAYQLLAIVWFSFAFILIVKVESFGGWKINNIVPVIVLCANGVIEANRHNKLKKKYSRVIEIHKKLTEK